MKVWLVKYEEDLPFDDSPYSHRMGMLGKVLSDKGHQVTRWCSDHNHKSGVDRFGRSEVVELNSNYKFILLRCLVHYKETGHGLKRLLHLYANSVLLCFRFLLVQKKDLPDVIVASMPPPIACAVVSFLGRLKGVPVVLDARDMWPDIFENEASASQRFAIKLLISLMRLELKYACKRATGLVGITDHFVNYLVAYSGRSRGESDIAFPIGFMAPVVQAEDQEDIIEAKKYWLDLGVDLDSSEHRFIYFAGTLSKTVLNAIDDVASALSQVEMDDIPVKLVLCGTGEYKDEIYRKLDKLKCVVRAGHVAPRMLLHLKRKSLFALLSIENRKDYQSSLSNKFFDYISGGLPIVTNLSGYPREIIKKHNVGFSYDSPAELVGIIKYCSENETELAELRTNAVSLYRNEYSSEVVYSKFTSYLEQVARK